MLKVLIADDEHIIKNGIKNSIDWEAIGMQVIAAVDNGREAYKVAKQQKPDIVITDIRMPFMDGLELIEKIKADNKDAFIIIISGHDEFKYAQTAIKLGAYEFIVKPIDLDYLKDTLKKINVAYNQRKNEIKVVDLNLDKEQVLQNLLMQVLFSSADKNSVAESFEKLGIARDRKCASVLFQIDYFNAQDSEAPSTQQFIDEVTFHAMQFSKFGDIVLLPDIKKGSVVAAVFAGDDKDIGNEVKRFVNKMRAHINIEDDITYSICVGNACGDIIRLKESYAEAMETANYAYVYGGGKDIFYTEYKKTLSDRNVDLSDDLYTFLTSMRSLDKDIIKKNLDMIKEMIKQSGADSFFYVKIIINSAYCMINETLHDFKITLGDIFENPVERYKKIMALRSIDDEFEQLYAFIVEICDFMNNKKDVLYNALIEKAKIYIGQNYSNSKLSVEEVSKNSHISPGYLSALFKQYIGKPFISYLTEIRIDKAKELLAFSQLRTYEICFNVGYDNPTYFSTVFKKHTGMTPTQYRAAQKEKA